MRPTWAEVSLPRLKRNFFKIQALVGSGVTVCAVVKADAYGHGAVECARALEEQGAEWFGVTSTEEGVRLRQAGVNGRILLMTGFWRGEEEEIVAGQLTPIIWEPWHAYLLARAVLKFGSTAFPVHLKVDSGMARLGIEIHDLSVMLEALRLTPQLELEGLATHLKSAEILDAADVQEQVTAFEKAKKIVADAGFRPRFRHLANSAALATQPEIWNEMVRPGVALYGYHLHFNVAHTKCWLPFPLLEPVLSWKTRIISLRQVGAHEGVGYGSAYVTRSPARLAALPVGYADGLSRRLSSRGRVIVRGCYAPMVGNIAMDITVVDVTQVEGVRVGDEVILLGATSDCRVDAWEHSRLEGTIPYEVLCAISSRVPRKYIREAPVNSVWLEEEDWLSRTR